MARLRRAIAILQRNYLSILKPIQYLWSKFYTMIQPAQFLKLVNKEIQLITALTKYITPEIFEYRPKENMRSVKELMQYLTGCGYNYAAYWFTDGSTPIADYFKNIRENQTPVTLDNFETLMQTQKNYIEQMILNIKPHQWQEQLVKLPWGEEVPLGEALAETSLKWLTAYKYQLMMYIKMSADLPLSTKETWVVS